MADYQSAYTGAEIDASVGRAAAGGQLDIDIDNAEAEGLIKAYPATASTASSVSINANNRVAITTAKTALSVTLVAGDASHEQEWRLVFIAGAGFSLTVTPPSGCAIIWDGTPEWTQGKAYEVSFCALGVKTGGSDAIGTIIKEWSI